MGVPGAGLDLVFHAPEIKGRKGFKESQVVAEGIGRTQKRVKLNFQFVRKARQLA